jgi:hypothetical protein
LRVRGILFTCSRTHRGDGHPSHHPKFRPRNDGFQNSSTAHAEVCQWTETMIYRLWDYTAVNVRALQLLIRSWFPLSGLQVALVFRFRIQSAGTTKWTLDIPRNCCQQQSHVPSGKYSSHKCHTSCQRIPVANRPRPASKLGQKVHRLSVLSMESFE